MNLIRKKINNEDGSVTIIMAVAMMMFMAIMAYVIDIGMVYAEGIKLSNALDAAALAAAMELPGDSVEALAVANEYLIENGIDLSQVTVEIGDEQKSIEISGKKEVNHYFAKVFGIDSTPINKKSKVALGAVKSVKGGIRPFAVEESDFQYGDLVTLKAGAGDGETGNYGALALGGSGA